MFVAWQADRTRAVRRTFVAVCLLPCVLAVGWGAWRRGPAHRDALGRGLESALGVDLSIGRVDHLRPGCVRLRDVVVRDREGVAVVALAAADLEWSAGEVRCRVADVEANPALVSAAVRAARAWLEEPGRFPRDVVVEVARLRTGPADGAVPAAPAIGLRAECVAGPIGRAIRVRAEPDSGDGLVVQSLLGSDGAPPRIETRGSVSGPLPAEVAAILLDWPSLPEVVGANAGLSGTLAMTTADVRRRSGTFSGVIDGVDLAACTRRLPFHAEGSLRVDVDQCRFEEDRLVSLAGVVNGGPGRADRTLLESVVAALGARPGPGWPAAGMPPSVPYDRLGVRFSIDASGAGVAGADGGPLLGAERGAILEPPSFAVPVERLAWAIAPSAKASVPATRVTGWLLSVLPLEGTTEGAGPRPAPMRR